MSTETETISLARELVGRRSITPEDGGCQQIIASRLESMGFQIETMDCGEVKNLWARKGTKSPLLTFVGHTDVVPIGNESEWTYPPFSATLADGFLHGRGAADMKGSVAAIITACERFFACQNSFTGSVSLLITSDEEGVAIDGTRYALDQLLNRSEVIDYCLVGEPTAEVVLGDTMKVGRRGSLSGEIVVYGKQGHVAYPHLADNPIHRAGELISGLASMKWNDGDELFPNTTLQISNVNSGVGVANVIPGLLQLKMNFRYSPATDASTLIKQVEDLCRELKLNYEATWTNSADSYYNDSKFFTDVVSDAVSRIMNRAPKISTAGGTSDGRFVAKSGAQVVELGPLNTTIHKVNECVGINDLNQLSLIYEQILEILFCEERPTEG